MSHPRIPESKYGGACLKHKNGLVIEVYISRGMSQVLICATKFLKWNKALPV
jgi:hypothetical protein